MNHDEMHNNVLCCPLCGSEEYLLSSSNSMLCAECGSFFENVTKLTPTNIICHRVGTVVSYLNNVAH